MLPGKARSFSEECASMLILKDVSSVIREILWEVTSMGTEEEREDSSGYTNLYCLGGIRKNFTIETSSFLRMLSHNKRGQLFITRGRKHYWIVPETQVLSRNQCLCRYVGGQIGKCPWGHWFKPNLAWSIYYGLQFTQITWKLLRKWYPVVAAKDTMLSQSPSFWLTLSSAILRTDSEFLCLGTWPPTSGSPHPGTWSPLSGSPGTRTWTPTSGSPHHGTASIFNTELGSLILYSGN